MSSFTLTLSGNSSELSANYYPPIELGNNGEYVCGLIDFQTFMSIPNVHEKNNVFCFVSETRCGILISAETRNDDKKIWRKAIEKVSKNGLMKKDIISTRIDGDIARDQHVNVFFQHYSYIKIPTGSYELDDIVKYLTKTFAVMVPDGFLHIEINKNVLKCELKCSSRVYFSSEINTIGSLLGFKDGLLESNELHISEDIIRINSINVVKIETNITTGAYSNDKLMRTLHEFYPSVDIGYKLVEVPNQVIYLPIAVRSIHNFVVRIVDQDNNLVDFRGETITLRVHIKRL